MAKKSVEQLLNEVQKLAESAHREARQSNHTCASFAKQVQNVINQFRLYLSESQKQTFLMQTMIQTLAVIRKKGLVTDAEIEELAAKPKGDSKVVDQSLFQPEGAGGNADSGGVERPQLLSPASAPVDRGSEAGVSGIGVAHPGEATVNDATENLSSDPVTRSGINDK